MNKLPRSLQEGFTLVEVMVGLVVGVLMIGGIMGLISVSLQYTQRVREMTRIQPILDAAAQEILARPELAEEGVVNLTAFPGTPSVRIEAVQSIDEEGKSIENRSGKLYRIKLGGEGAFLELSVIVPKPQEDAQTGEENGDE